MNVNPVAAPGHTSSGQVAARAANQQASKSASDQVDTREPSTTIAAGAVRQQFSASALDRGNIRERSATAPAALETNLAASADRQKAEQLKAFIGDNNVRLSTYHDEASGRSVLEVRDQVTGDVVGQYPSEELVRLYAALRQPLVDQSA